MTFDSADIVALVQQLPEWAKITSKFILAAPFTYHGINGLRHLSWDMGKRKLRTAQIFPASNSALVLTVKGAWRSGYIVIAASAISTIALVFW